MKTDKELADELDARDRLRSRGYEWKPCVICNGIALDYCSACQGKGGHWQGPLMRSLEAAPTPESRAWWNMFNKETKQP